MAPVLFHKPVLCWFCNTAQAPSPRDIHNFRCTNCEAFNRYDARGEPVGSEPAMHVEELNQRSFAKRASPSKDRLPSEYGKSAFCTNCQTNQMLIVNLLANYLPPPDVRGPTFASPGRPSRHTDPLPLFVQNPEYEKRLAALPAYRESLHARYPPVCKDCMPGVEEEMNRKEAMARTKALGGFLGKGKSTQRGKPNLETRQRIGVQLLAWKVRGCLWVLTLLLSLVANGLVGFGRGVPVQLTLLQPCLPPLALLSILWTFWDPTYSACSHAQLQGREVRIQGKQEYIAAQGVAWLSRLVTSVILATAWWKPQYDFLSLSEATIQGPARLYFSSCFTIEIAATIVSLLVLRVKQPPKIRLIDTTTHRSSFSSSGSARSSPAPQSTEDCRQSLPANSRRSGTPALDPADADFLAGLSLSSRPVLPTKRPIFGLPSLLGSTPSLVIKEDEEDENAMDWTPTDPSSSRRPRSSVKTMNGDDGAWLRPQRFFAPEKPTGLEGLFERTRLIDETYGAVGGRRGAGRWKWWVYALSMVPLLVAWFGYKMWASRTGSGSVAEVVLSTGTLPVEGLGEDPWTSYDVGDQ